MRVPCMAAAVVAATATPALADVYDGDWHFSLSPYAWLAGSDTSLQFRMPGGAVSRTTLSASPTDVVKHLHFGFFGFSDVRKGEWSAFSDLMYVSLGDSATIVHSITLPNGSVQVPINLRTNVGLQELAWT